MILFLTVIDVGKAYSQQGVAISESPATPDQWAILDLQSSLRGFLAPRMTTAQRLTLGTKPPAQGMLVYDTDTKSFWYFDSGWKAIAATALGSSNQLLGMNNAGTANEYKTLLGTSNRISVDLLTPGQITLSAPQDIHTGASPIFNGLTLNGNLQVNGTFKFDPAGQAVDNIRTSIRATGSTDDVSLVTESAIRAAINSSVTASNGLHEDPDGNIKLGGNLIEATTVTNNGNSLTFDGSNGDLTIAPTGNISLSGTATLTTGTGQVLFGGNVDANNGVDITGAPLTVATAADLNSTLDVAGQTDLAASGTATNVRGTLNVAEQAAFTGNVDASNGIDVLNGDLNVTDNLNVTTNATISGDALVDGDFRLDAAGQQVDNIRTDVRATGSTDNVTLVTESAVRTAINSSVTANNGVRENPDGNIQLGGDLTIPTDIGVEAGTTLTVSDATEAAALSVNESGAITIGNGTVTTGTGQVTIGGNVNANSGIDISGAALTVDNQAITQTTGGQVTFAGNVDANSGLDVTGAAITTNQSITQTGTNQVTFGGNVDASNGLDVTGAAITTNQSITQTGTNQVSFGGNVDAANGIDITSGNLTVAGNATVTGNTRVDGNFQFDAIGQAVDNISIETDLDNGSGALNTVLPTQLAVKSYVDSQVSNIGADNGITEDVPGHFQLGGDLIKPTEIGVEAGTTLTVSDAMEAAALSVNESGAITIGNGTVTTGTGQVTIGGNVNANNGVDVSGAALTVDNQNITQTGTNQVTFGGNVDANNGIDVTGAAITTDQSITQTGANQVTFGGNVDANNGLDVTGAAITTNQSITQTGTNQVSFGGNVDANNGIDITSGNLTVAGNSTVTGNSRVDGNFQFDASGQAVDNISTETDLDNGSGALNTVLPTQLAVKSYVDSQVSNIGADNGITEDVPGHFQLGGDLIKPTDIGVEAGTTLTVSDASEAAALSVNESGAITIGNGTVTTGTGQVTIGGNVNANNGVDVSGAALTVDNQSITQTGANQVTFGGNVDANNGLDVTGAPLTVATPADLNSTLDVSGQTDLAGTGVSTNVRGTLTVAEQSNFNGNVNANNGLNVTAGNLAVANDATITGNTRVDGNFQFDVAGQAVNNIRTDVRASASADNFTLVTEAGIRTAINTGVTADNGLHEDPDGNIRLGGNLEENTTINNNGFDLVVDGANSDFSVNDEGKVLLNGTEPLEITSTGGLITTTADINGGTIDGTTIGGSAAAPATVTNLIANGTVTLSNNSIESNEITDGTIVDIDINSSAAINATKLAAGTVDNTEFGYLNGVTSSIQTQFNNLQTELDNTQSGAGLAATGAYVANGGANYISGATSLNNADVILDGQLFTTTSNLGTEITNRTNADAAIQTEVDAIETGSGLSNAGAYVVDGTTTYLTTATSLANADKLLDTQLAANGSSISGLQTELDNTQSGAGLAATGAYVANGGANYISGATSLNNADVILDGQIKLNTDIIATKANIAGQVFTGAISATNLSNTNTGDVTIGTANGLSLSSQQLSLSLATGAASGAMSSADKTKLDAILGTNTGDQTITLTGDVTGSGTGSFATTIGVGKVTSSMILNNEIVDADINASAGIADTKLATISTSGKVANSATTASSSNGANTIVLRDASNDFTAGTITATLNGNAATATTATTAGNVTGVVALANGGTGTNLSAGGATGDLIVGVGTTGMARIADVALGRVLVSGGAGANPSYSATPVLGVAGTTLGTISLSGNTSGVVAIQPQAAAGTYNFNLPTGAGTSGQPLLSGGGGATAMTFGTLGVGAGGTGQTSQQSALNALAGGVTSGQYLRGNGTNILLSSIQAGDVPTLNQSTTGNAATATNLAGGNTNTIPYQTATSTTNMLAASTAAGQFLQTTASGGAPSWKTVLSVANGGTGLTTFGGNNTVLYTSTANNISSVASSTSAGQFLQTTSSGAAPTWKTVLGISNGGTNSSTSLNNNRVMISSGGSIVESSTLNNGQLLIGSTGNTPVSANITAGNGIAITNGAGSISVAFEPTIYQQTGTSASSLTTTSTSDVQLSTPMSYTIPSDGDYLVTFTAVVSNNTTGRGVIMSIYNNGTRIEASEIQATSGQAGDRNTIASQAYIQGMTASQVIDIRWRAESNTATIRGRTLIVQKVK